MLGWSSFALIRLLKLCSTEMKLGVLTDTFFRLRSTTKYLVRGSPSLVGSRPAKSVVHVAARVQIPHPAPLRFIGDGEWCVKVLMRSWLHFVETIVEHVLRFSVIRWVAKSENILVRAVELGLACVRSSKKIVKGWQIRNRLTIVLSVQIFRVQHWRLLINATEKNMD